MKVILVVVQQFGLHFVRCLNEQLNMMRLRGSEKVNKTSNSCYLQLYDGSRERNSEHEEGHVAKTKTFEGGPRRGRESRSHTRPDEEGGANISSKQKVG